MALYIQLSPEEVSQAGQKVAVITPYALPSQESLHGLRDAFLGIYAGTISLWALLSLFTLSASLTLSWPALLPQGSLPSQTFLHP